MGQGALDRSDPGSRRTNRCSHLESDGMLGRQAIPERVTRVLNRATWSSRELSRLLLVLLVRLFFPGNEPLIMGIDETIERRRGRKIAARGVYRDPVRSSKEFFVKTNGLRWMRADAADSDPVSLPCLGLALFERVGSLRTLP